MKQIDITIGKLYMDEKFDSCYKEFNSVYDILSILNNCISDISSDMRTEKSQYTCASKIIEAIKTIIDKYNKSFLCNSYMINEFLNNENKKEENIFDCMSECLEDYKKPIKEAIAALRSSVYRYQNESNYIVLSSNTIFGLEEKLRKNKDGCLITVLTLIYDVYNGIIVPNMLDNSYFAKKPTWTLYKFIVDLRNILIDYANSIKVSVYIEK